MIGICDFTWTDDGNMPMNISKDFHFPILCSISLPCFSSRVRSEQSLVRWATPQLHDIDALAKMVDPALNGMYPAKSLSRFADIIALCVQVMFFTNNRLEVSTAFLS